MDTGPLYEAMRQLQIWRNQITGLGLLPPDVTGLLKFVEEAPAEAERLKQEIADLKRETAALAEQHRRDQERFTPLRAEVAEMEEKLRGLKQAFAEFKTQVGVGV